MKILYQFINNGNDLLKGLKILKSIKLMSDVSKYKMKKKTENKNDDEKCKGESFPEQN